jgi:sugar lactone lactonase YvrE
MDPLVRMRPGASFGTRRVRPFATLLGLCAAVALAGACAFATGPPRKPAWNNPELRLVWPRPPEPPRIEYLGVLRSPTDLGRKIGLTERLIAALFGEDDTAMVKPIAVAKNGKGMLVVADPGVPTVHLFDLERREYERLDGELASLLRSPVGVAVSDTDRVYVADSVQGKVFVFNRRRKLIAELGQGVLVRPTGLALSPGQERLYVVDTVACRVVVFDHAGREVARFGRRGGGLGEFNAPTHVSVGPDGTIGVSDSLNFRVQTFRPDGTPLSTFGEPGDGAGDFARPKGVATDTFGRFYVVDAAFENVQIFDPDGTLLLAFGSPGTGPGEFFLPSGLFLDPTNTVWVADSFNQRVQVFRLLMD